MSGYKHETKAARAEGVDFRFNTLPVSIEKTAQGLRVQLRGTRVAGDRVVADGETTSLDVGLVLAATGQAKLTSLLEKTPGLRFEGGRLAVDPKTGRTGNAKIYAGGDLANGGMEVVNAVAEGKRAAMSIGAMLGGE
jgi:glutamate synthase (NADPH/NADH) small chain